MVQSPREIINKLKQDMKDKKKLLKKGSKQQSPSQLCFDMPSSEEDEFVSGNKPKAPKYIFKDNIDVEDFFRLNTSQ